MKRMIYILVLTSLLASALYSAEYTIKFSHVVNKNTPKGKAADFFAKRVDELTAGKVEVKVFPSSQLYSDKEVMKALKLGDVQMAAPSFSKFTRYVPQLQLFDLPFLFRDINHVHAVMDGEVGLSMKTVVDKRGFIALSYWDNGFKHFSSSKKALINPEDAKGQRVRIMSSRVIEAQFLSVKANPQVLPFLEVYSALEHNIVDASENPLSNFYTKKFYKVQSSLTLSSHGYLGYLVIISKKFWKKLPTDLKSKITQAINEATQLNRILAAEFESEYLFNLKEYAKKTGKLDINTLTKKQKEAWKISTSVIYKDFYKVIGKELIQKAQE